MDSKMKKIFFSKSYFTISVLGNSLKLNIKYEKRINVKIERLEREINIIIPYSYKDSNNEEIINICIQKIYDDVAKKEIENAMEFARYIYGFAPEDYIFKRMEDLFYKCFNKKLIINPDIVQFNREIIFTTIIKAFCKFKYKEGSKNYKIAIQKGLDGFENYKKNNMQIYKNVS